MAKVLLENLSKNYGSVKDVEDLSLEVKDKEFLTILGHSGCGKTTSLRMIAGLEEPSGGNIYIGDTLANELAPKDRDLGMVFQNYALFPNMSVFDNIAFPLKTRKVGKEEIKKRVENTADLLQIRELLARKPKQLSGGQQQRVALGRSIVREPKVFLMDEPLSNLDAKLRVYMRTEIRLLQKRIGTTTIYVTHDQVEAMTMSDRVALLNVGRLQQLGTPEELYKHPRTTFVGGFVGTPPMNLIKCSLRVEKGSVQLVASGFTLDMSSYADALQKDDGREVTLGVRPEDTAISTTKTAGAIAGKVVIVESLGRDFLVNIKLGDDVLKVRVDSTTVKSGSDVWLVIDPKKVHIFNASGDLIL